MRLNAGPVVAPARNTVPHAILLGSILFLSQLLFWHGRIESLFYPAGDDFSLLAHSTRVFHAHPSEWFTRGFHNYFRPYPDLAIPYSDFLRPGANAVYYLNSLVFGRDWSAYLLANYLIAASLCAVTFALAYGVLRLPVALAALVTLATIASPAYTYHIVYRPSFAFDYLGGLLALLCLLSLLRGRWRLAWIFTLLAVFTKETAYYTALAACLTLLAGSPVRQRLGQLPRALSFLLPLCFAVLLRRFDFRNAGGVYVLSGLTPKGLVRNVVLGLTQWPYIFPGEQHIFERSLGNIASLLLSAVLWLLLAMALRLCWQSRSASLQLSQRPLLQQTWAVLIFLLCSCALPIALGLGPRFGASTFPLLFLTLAAFATLNPRRGWAPSLAVFSLCLMTVVDAVALGKTFSPQIRRPQLAQWVLGRSLITALQAERHPTVFLIADTSESLSSADSVQTFSGTQAHIVPVSSLALGSCDSPPHIDVVPSAGHFISDSTLPTACGTYLLLGTGRRPGDTGQYLHRDLPEADITYTSPKPVLATDTYDWQTLHIELVPKSNDLDILVPDLRAGQYRSATR